MSGSEQVELVRRMLERVDAGQLEGVAEVLAPDCEFVHPMATLQGPAQVVGFLEGSIRAFPDMRHDITAVAEAAGLVMAELTWTGTLTGPMTGPGGEIPPTGRRAEVPVAGAFRAAGGRLTSVRFYTDRLGLMEQLGLVPAPAGA